MKSWILVLSILGLLATWCHATIIVSYQSGITAAAGQSGASDPVSQGWIKTDSNGANAFADTFDSGDGGWRTVDGTGSAPANFRVDLNGTQVADLSTATNWELTWTVALDQDAIRQVGAPVTGYYINGNSGNQNNLLTLVDLDDQYRYFLTHEVNGSNQLQFNDNAGGVFNTGIDVTAGWPNFQTFNLVYTAGSNSARLFAGGSVFDVGQASADPNRNAVYFGAGNSAGQGSAIWNELGLETNVIPEPSAFALLLLGLCVLGSRLRRQ